MDALALEAVVGAHSQVERLDRRRELLGDECVGGRRSDVDALGLEVELTGQTEELDQRLAGRGDGVARGHRLLGLDIDHETVEVSALLDTGGLDLVGHLEDRGVDRVDRNAADLHAGLLVLHGGDVAATALNDELHLQLALAVERGDVEIGVVHLDTRGRGNVGCGDRTRALLAEVHHDRLVMLGGDNELLDVEDHLGDVLLDSRHGGELVQDAVDTDAGDSSAGDRGEERAANRVAEGVAETGLERLHDEARAVFRNRLFDEGRSLGDQHVSVLPRRPLFDADGGSCGGGAAVRTHPGGWARTTHVTWSRAPRSAVPGPGCRSLHAQAGSARGCASARG